MRPEVTGRNNSDPLNGTQLVPSEGPASRWIIIDEPELHLGEGVVVPDLAGWRRDRMSSVPEGVAFTIPPDWVCEVASKSTEKLDRRKKLPLYASVGIGHAWLIHPRLRTLEVLRLHDGKWLGVGVYADDEKVRAEPFDALEIDLSLLWSDFPTRASETAAEYAESAW